MGIIVAILMFSGEKNSNTSVPATYNPQSQIYYQPQPAYQQSKIPSYSSPTSCTVDCSGHEAGYEWAEENGIDDPDDCGGNSDSFIEGCQMYAEEQAAEEKTTDHE